MPKSELFNKSLVLEQATDVFQDKGFNATSMQDLVNATGLNRSSIYNSFVSKLELYLECLKYYEDNFHRETSKSLLKASDSLHAINLIFELYIKIITEDQYDKGCLVTNCKAEMANHEKSITSFLENSQNSMLMLLEDLVSNGQHTGVINKKQSAKNYALYLYSSLQGFRMTGILITNRTHLNSIVKSVLQTIT